MAQAIGLEPPESRLELLLDVDQQQFRCRVDATSEVGPSPPVSPLPRTPSWLVGLALAHERVVPVVDLSRVLGLAHSPQAVSRERMLTVHEPGLWVGLLVDDVRRDSDPSLPELDLANVVGALRQRLLKSLVRAR